MNKLTNNDRELLKSKSAYVLPSNPSDKGLSADQIKKRLYEGLMLLFEWLKRAIEDTDNIDKKYEEELKNYVKNVDGIATNLKLQGTITADSQAVINLSNVIKVLIPQPTENNSAIRKLDLDNVNNNLDAKKVNKTNDTLYNPTVSGTLKGDFLLGTQGTADMSPTTKKYTDDKLNDLKSTTSSDLLATKNELQTNINQARQYAEQLINDLINGAPSAFDTLKEIADYISSDQSATSAMLASIQKNAQDILLKANSNDVYTKEEVDTKLDYKANSIDVYKKSEVDNLLNKKQDTLKSGENIKTFGGISILGAGNIPTPESNTTIQVIGNPEGAGTEVLNTLLIGEKIYKIKEGYVNLDIDCDHEYEITGKTGHEYGVAIEDSQMLLKKIQGQTRRYSLNLLKQTYTSNVYGLSAEIQEDGSIIFNGTPSQDAVFYIEFQELLGTYSLRFDGINPSTTTIGVSHIGKITSNAVKTWTWTTKKLFAISYTIKQGTVCNKYVIKPMLVEGTYTDETMPPFQPYDDTLVNSKCNLVSTGRNLLCYKTTNGKLNGLTYSFNGNIVRIKGTATADTAIYSDMNELLLNGSYYWKPQANKVNNMPCALVYDNATIMDLNNSSDILIELTNTKVNRMLWYISNGTTIDYEANIMLNYGNQPVEYEPYTEEEIPLGIELGAYDYIDNVSHLLVKQTSDVITLDGSSDEEYVYDADDGYISYDTKIKLNNGGISNKLTYDYTSGTNNFGTFWVTRDTRIIFGIRGSDITSVEAWKTYLQSNPIQVVAKLATPTTTQLLLPAGYAVYTGGLQQQVIKGKYLPYVLSKEYAVSMAAQIKTNIEIDRVQQEQINEYKSKLSSLEQRLAALEELNTNKIIL